MSDAREDILARIREVERPPQPPLSRAYRRRAGRSALERARLFAERLSDYAATVQFVRPDTVADAATAACTERSAHRIVMPPGLPAAWRPAPSELLTDSGLTAVDLDHVDGVITGCTLAIAETGTIVLGTGPIEGRRALTLVPDLHICVVRTSQIVDGVTDAFAALDSADAKHRTLTFISGPSATSDIELSRVEGVHGPRNLVVLIEQPTP